MKSMTKGFILALGTMVLLARVAAATPSTTYWTPSTSDIQPYGVWHIGIDNYFTVGQPKADKRGDLPTDVGLTVGVLPYEKIQLEVGIDLLEPSSDPVFFNAKLGTPEGALFEGSPALNIGIFNAGTDSSSTDGDGRTDFNIIHYMIGKTLPFSLGRLHGGGYVGNEKALVDKNNEKENTGFMIGYDKGFHPSKDEAGEYNKWVLAADYLSGKNAIGGGGVGIYHYFTRNISLLTGPVWFNEPTMVIGNDKIKWTWTTQLDINF